MTEIQPLSTKLLMLDPHTIRCEDRQRRDLGDIETLAESIKELGQLQPILITADNRLVAGGRRLAACKHLNIKVLALHDTDIPEGDLEMLELEENVRRKALSWQEEALAVARIHTKHSIAASRKLEKWMPRYTGAMLGLSQASVYSTLAVAQKLEKGDAEVWKCTGVTDALQLLARRKAKEAERRLVDITSDAPAPDSEAVAETSTVNVAVRSQSTPLRKLTVVHGSACEWLETQPDNSIGCIYTDPPYAIDMDNLQQDGGGMKVDNVRDTHGVADGLEELARFVPLAARKLNGFLVMWCDVWHFRWLADLCDANGLNVQRWPVYWVKSSPCQNMAAAYNFTKSVECALVARTHKHTLGEPIAKCHWIGDNDKPEWTTNPFFKPIELHHFILRAVAIPGTTVVDPYGGCGSIPLACITKCWDAVMVEKDQTHIAALQRYLATL